MKEPVDHIIRAQLPWRDGSAAITECGYDASKVQALTREGYLARFKELGERRSAMLTCMTCSGVIRDHATWDEDPRSAIGREIAWEGRGRWVNKERGVRLRDELVAIASLIEAHKDEFLEAVSAIEQRRDWLEKKDALANRPIRKDGRSL